VVAVARLVILWELFDQLAAGAWRLAIWSSVPDCTTTAPVVGLMTTEASPAVTDDTAPVAGVCQVADVPPVAVRTWPVVGVAGTDVPLILVTVAVFAPAEMVTSPLIAALDTTGAMVAVPVTTIVPSEFETLVTVPPVPGVCQVALVPDVAVSTCPEVGVAGTVVPWMAVTVAVFDPADMVTSPEIAALETTGAIVGVPVTVMVPSLLETEVTVPEPEPPSP
jgi:hypothetical protein